MNNMLEDGFKMSGFDVSTVPFSSTMGQLSFIKSDKNYKNFERLSPIIFEGLSMTYTCYKLIEQSCTCKIYGKMQIQNFKDEYQIYIKINDVDTETLKFKSWDIELKEETDAEGNKITYFDFETSQLNIDLNELKQSTAILSISIDAASFIASNKLYDINFDIHTSEQQEQFLSYVRLSDVNLTIKQDPTDTLKVFLTAEGKVSKTSSVNIYALRLIPLEESDTGALQEPKKEDDDFITQCNMNVTRYLNLPEKDKGEEKNFNIFNNSLRSLEDKDVMYNDNIVTGILTNSDTFKFSRNQIGTATIKESGVKERFNDIFFWLRTSDKDLKIDSISQCSIEVTDVCLSGDTLITMADGSTKELKSISKNDLVLTTDGKITKVINVKSNGTNFFYVLYHFENNINIKEVFPHRFYNDDLGFWEHLQNWKIGEHGLTASGDRVALLSKEIVYTQEEGFGLFTEEGSYFANGLLSGPASCNKKLLSKRGLKEAVKVASNLSNSQLRGLLQIEDF